MRNGKAYSCDQCEGQIYSNPFTYMSRWGLKLFCDTTCSQKWKTHDEATTIAQRSMALGSWNGH